MNTQRLVCRYGWKIATLIVGLSILASCHDPASDAAHQAQQPADPHMVSIKVALTGLSICIGDQSAGTLQPKAHVSLTVDVFGNGAAANRTDTKTYELGAADAVGNEPWPTFSVQAPDNRYFEMSFTATSEFCGECSDCNSQCHERAQITNQGTGQYSSATPPAGGDYIILKQDNRVTSCSCQTPPPDCRAMRVGGAGGTSGGAVDAGALADAGGSMPGDAADAPMSDAVSTAAPAAGASLWLSGDVGITAASGRVSSWADQSGSHNDAFMDASVRQPALVSTALNGHAVVHFDGAQSLQLTRAEAPRSFSIFVVGRNGVSSEDFSMILGPSGSSPNNQLRWENGTSALIVGTGNDLPTTTIAIGDTRVYHLLAVRFDGAQLTVARDGQVVSSQALTDSGPWLLAQIGAWYSTYFMVGDLAELMIYDGALTTSDFDATSAYLRARYALP